MASMRTLLCSTCHESIVITVILSLIACSPTSSSDTNPIIGEATTTQHISINELEIAFEDRDGNIMAPAGDILSASMCYEEQDIFVCESTKYGIDSDGYVHITLNLNTVGVIKYVNITEE